MANKDHSLDRRIKEASLDDFFNFGYQKSSLHRIALKAGVTTGALYTRYKGKDDLFLSIVSPVFGSFKSYGKEMMEKYQKAKESKDGNDFLDAMKYECDIYFNVLYSLKTESIILFCKSEGSSAKDLIKQMMKYKEEQTVAFFEEGAKERSKRENNKELLQDFNVDKNAIALLMNMQFSLFNKVLELDLDKDEAKKCMKTMEEFVSFGWKNLFEKYI